MASAKEHTVFQVLTDSTWIIFYACGKLFGCQVGIIHVIILSTVTDNLDKLCNYFDCRIEQLVTHIKDARQKAATQACCKKMMKNKAAQEALPSEQTGCA